MERFPTWQVWSRLHGHLPEGHYEALARVLRFRGYAPSTAALNHVLVWMFMSVVFSNWLVAAHIDPIYAALILRVAITTICFFFAIQIANAISKQRELTIFDLFLVLPRGEIASVFDIARTFRDPRDGVIREKWFGLIIACVIAFYSWVYPRPITDEAFLGITLFIDYLQSFVAAMLIAFIVTQRQERMRALVWLVVSFLVMQVMLYVGLMLTLDRLAYFGLVSEGINSDTGWWVYAYWGAILQPLMLIICRELVNFILWQAVKRRLED